MAGNDFRSRNGREKRTQTTTHRQNYQGYESQGVSDWMPNDHNYPGRKMGSPITVGGKEFNRVSRDGTTLMRITAQRGPGASAGGSQFKMETAKLANKTKVTHRSSTGYAAKDGRNGKSDADDKSQKIKSNRKGRDALRVKAKGDASASRLKPGPKRKKDLRVGVQGGSKSGNGINAPR